MDERSKRIVKTAIDLAEKGGYDAVRLRDVANHAQVALGTVYKRFRSKEDMLVAAVEVEIARMEERVHFSTPPGSTPADRVTSLFQMITDLMMQRPKLSRAVMRAVTSGEPAIAKKVLRFQNRSIDLIADTLIGKEEPLPFTEDQIRPVANLLQQVWFAAMVGWMGGLHEPEAICQQVRKAATLLIAGLEVAQD